MGKWFWCCTAAGVLAVSGLYLVARNCSCAQEGPMSRLVKKWLGKESHCEGCPRSPVEVDLPADPVAIPDDPTADSQIVAVAQPQLPTHIAIDDVPIQAAQAELFEPCEQQGFVPVAVEVRDVPSFMPYAQDDENEKPRFMPYADDQILQVKAEESTTDCWLDVMIESICSLCEKLSEQTGADEPSGTPETRFPNLEPYPEYYQYHNRCCPVSGHCYPKENLSPPIPEAAQEKKDKPAEESSEPKKPEAEKLPTAPKEKESRVRSHEEEMEEQEMFPRRWDIDTMEFRPSDAGLDWFIPGPL